MNIEVEDIYAEEEESIDSPSLQELSKIISYNVANTVEVIKLKIDNTEIDLEPEFQREFVWDIKRASLFIDSLLIGLPIPSIFLGKSRDDENYIVIDGQQRLKSVYYYITGKFISNDKEVNFKLRNLKGREWNGKSYEELEEVQRRRINNAILNTTVIEDINYRPKVVHDLFYRLNTGGMPLTDQEIRNCVYPGALNALIIELNKNTTWRKLLGKEQLDKRLRDVELVLRFIALFYELDNYFPSMREFLTTFQSTNKKNNAIISGIPELFNATVEVIYNELGDDAFRLRRYFNKSVCDSTMVTIAKMITDGHEINSLRTKHNKMLADDKYKKYVTEGTTTETHVQGRMELAMTYYEG